MKKILFFASILICLLVINNLVRSIYATWQKQEFLVVAQKEVDQEQARHAQLEQQLQIVSQEQFVEQQARDKLLLVKPGEQLVILPPGLISPTPTPGRDAMSQKPHWQQWWAYFAR